MTSKRLFLLAALAVPALPALAQTATPPPRIRGTVETVDGHVVTVKTGAGDTATVRLADGFKVTGAIAATVADIKPGLFIGTASVPGPDASQTAIEVTLFPPSMNGTGEGSYAWDLGTDSTMTNGTVGGVMQAQGRTMTVKYGDRERTVTIPDDVPVVLLNPGADASLVKPGAHVVIAPSRAADGTLTAARVTVGENGVVPPM